MVHHQANFEASPFKRSEDTGRYKMYSVSLAKVVTKLDDLQRMTLI